MTAGSSAAGSEIATSAPAPASGIPSGSPAGGRISVIERVQGPGRDVKVNVESELEGLAKIRGLRTLQEIPGVKRNWAYFPILVDAGAYGMSRDDVRVISNVLAEIHSLVA